MEMIKVRIKVNGDLAETCRRKLLEICYKFSIKVTKVVTQRDVFVIFCLNSEESEKKYSRLMLQVN